MLLHPRNRDLSLALVPGDRLTGFLSGVTFAELVSKLSEEVLVLSRTNVGGTPAAGTFPVIFFTWQWGNMRGP